MMADCVWHPSNSVETLLPVQVIGSLLPARDGKSSRGLVNVHFVDSTATTGCRAKTREMDGE